MDNVLSREISVIWLYDVQINFYVFVLRMSYFLMARYSQYFGISEC